MGSSEFQTFVKTTLIDSIPSKKILNISHNHELNSIISDLGEIEYI